MITYYAAQSSDGFIAGPKGELDFLKYAEIGQQDYGYHDFYKALDTCVMGRGTWDMVRGFGQWPYPDKENWVITSKTDLKPMANESFAAFDPGQWKKLGSEKNVWMVGGGEIAQVFHDAGLIDRCIITTLPDPLGEGIPLFPKGFKESEWKLVESKEFEKGIVMKTWEKA